MFQLSSDLMNNKVSLPFVMNRDVIVSKLSDSLENRKICYAFFELKGKHHHPRELINIMVSKKGFRNISGHIHEFGKKENLISY